MTENQKSSTDVYLIAALLSLGAELVKVDRDDPRHMVFTVQNPIPLENSEFYIPLDFSEIEKQWANSTLTVNAQKFKDAIQRMKSVIHSK